MAATPLKKFYALTLNDPLFASEGLDLDDTRWAIDELADIARDLERVYRKSYWWFCFRYPFIETLHPIRFLRRFVDCELGRRRFLTNPTSKNARSLLSAWSKAASAYNDGASAYRDALEAVLKSEKVPLDAFFQFTGSSFSFEEVVKFTDSLLENAAELKNEIDARRALSEGRADSFSPRAFNDPIPQKQSGPSLTPSLERALSWREEATRENAVILRRCGPIFYELPHYDGVPTTHQFFVYLIKAKTRERRAIKFALADQYYFVDTKELLEKDQFPRFRTQMWPLLEAGVPYIYRQPEVPYMVLDLGYWADLATIADLEWRGLNVNQSLVQAQRSSAFNLILRHLNRYNRGFTEAQRIAKLDHRLKPLVWAYVCRSYPSMLFLTANRSVWRLPRRFRFRANLFREPYMKTFEEVAPRLSPKTLKKTLRREAWQ